MIIIKQTGSSQSKTDQFPTQIMLINLMGSSESEPGRNTILEKFSLHNRAIDVQKLTFSTGRHLPVNLESCARTLYITLNAANTETNRGRN